ncbi:MAG TPA: molybdenum cofactor biosynthesis protein MoaE [Candidatus Tyrphobacter sp.]
MFGICRTPIDVAAVEAGMREDGIGGMVTFTGVVRERADDDRVVDGLTYESYEPMALEEFAHIAEEARGRWPGTHIAIFHRVGELRVGEIAVAVVAAAPHRAEAFAACAYAVDQLKTRAPIWKKERYADGTPGRWRSNEGPTAP